MNLNDVGMQVVKSHLLNGGKISEAGCVISPAQWPAIQRAERVLVATHEVCSVSDMTAFPRLSEGLRYCVTEIEKIGGFIPQELDTLHIGRNAVDSATTIASLAVIAAGLLGYFNGLVIFVNNSLNPTPTVIDGFEGESRLDNPAQDADAPVGKILTLPGMPYMSNQVTPGYL